MHNLAVALQEKGDIITGSDDEIKEPSRSRLAAHGLLPEKMGWFPEKLNNEIDIVILGMHARPDNPELLEAKRLGLKICSFPEYLFQQTRDKMRVVISGSHGKTTITAMVLHVLHKLNIPFDYLIGAQMEGFDAMLSLNEETRVASSRATSTLLPSSTKDLNSTFTNRTLPSFRALSGTTSTLSLHSRITSNNSALSRK